MQVCGARQRECQTKYKFAGAFLVWEAVLIYITLFKYVRLFAWKIARPYFSKKESIRVQGSMLMGTIFNHASGSTKLNRPQEELNQGVQIAVATH
uniref:Uncharacterized protein n=1 Tax=Caenorhabditis japonica TaxID=281687 RepID=A0A8R1EF45_CAEJA